MGDPNSEVGLDSHTLYTPSSLTLIRESVNLNSDICVSGAWWGFYFFGDVDECLRTRSRTEHQRKTAGTRQQVSYTWKYSNYLTLSLISTWKVLWFLQTPNFYCLVQVVWIRKTFSDWPKLRVDVRRRCETVQWPIDRGPNIDSNNCNNSSSKDRQLHLEMDLVSII